MDIVAESEPLNAPAPFALLTNTANDAVYVPFRTPGIGMIFVGAAELVDSSV
jgi:hypothetical protein